MTIELLKHGVQGQDPLKEIIEIYDTEEQQDSMLDQLEQSL